MLGQKLITYPTRTTWALIANFFNRWTVWPLLSCIEWVGKRKRIELVSSNGKRNLVYTLHHTTETFYFRQWSTFEVHSSLHPTPSQNTMKNPIILPSIHCTHTHTQIVPIFTLVLHQWTHLTSLRRLAYRLKWISTKLCSVLELDSNYTHLHHIIIITVQVCNFWNPGTYVLDKKNNSNSNNNNIHINILIKGCNFRGGKLRAA